MNIVGNALVFLYVGFFLSLAILMVLGLAVALAFTAIRGVYVLGRLAAVLRAWASRRRSRHSGRARPNPRLAPSAMSGMQPRNPRVDH